MNTFSYVAQTMSVVEGVYLKITMDQYVGHHDFEMAPHVANQSWKQLI